MRIDFRPYLKGTPWCVDMRSEGGGRHHFATEREARAAAGRAAKEDAETGKEWEFVSEGDRASIIRTLRDMRAKGVTLDELWSAYLKRQLASATPTTSPPLSEAIRHSDILFAFVAGP